MRQKTSHTGNPETSDRLKTAVEILKEATGPLTGKEMREASQAPGRYYLENPSTCVFEIGKAPGWVVSDGRNYGQTPGPAVKFPDGKYRYWLVEAPGWHQSWTVNEQFQVVQVKQGPGSSSQGPGLKPTETFFDEELGCDVNLFFSGSPRPPVPCTPDPGPCLTRTCKACGKEIGDGLPFCDELCKNAFLQIGKPE